MNSLRTLVSALFLLLVSVSHGQFRHFPHGHEAVFVQHGSFVKCKFDSTYFYTTYSADSALVLMDYNMEYCDNQSDQYPFYLISVETGFLYNQNRLLIIENGWHLVDIPDTFKLYEKSKSMHGIEVYYEKKDWYDSNGIQDSAAWIYPLKNGIRDPKDKPYILGFNVGWIELPTSDLLQYSLVVNGESQYMPNLSWQDFYPERAGDVKMWQYGYSWYNESGKPKGRIDSFIHVEVFSDSLIWTLESRILNYYYQWEPATTRTFTVKPEPHIRRMLDKKLTGSVLNVINFDSVNYTEVFHYDLRQVPNSDLVHFGLGFYGYILDGSYCRVNQIADVGKDDHWNTWYGYYADYFSSYSYEDKKLVAARVGAHQFGNLHPLGTNDHRSVELKIFPNPANNKISVNPEFIHAEYSLYNIQGSLISTGRLETNEIVLDDVPEGLYILKIQSSGNQYSGKIQVLRP